MDQTLLRAANSPGNPTILLVHWGRTGAGPRITFELARSLASSHDIVVSFNADSEVSPKYSSIPVRHLPVSTYRTRLGVVLGLPRMFLHSLRLRNFIRRNQVKIVISPMFNIWQSFGLRTILPKDVIFVSCIHDASAHPGEESVIADWCRREEWRRADGVFTFSSKVANEFRELTGYDRPVLHTVHPAFTDSDGALRSSVRALDSRRDTRLGFFGRLLPYKGVDLLVDAYIELRARGLSVELKIVGSGDPGSYVVTSADLKRGIQLDNRWVDEAEVNKVVADFDVLVLPYREASQSGALAVALAEGVPVVVTPVGGLPEQIGETGAGVVSRAVSAMGLADAIESVIADPSAYVKYSANALTSARQSHSWPTVSAEIYEFAIALAAKAVK